MCIIISRNMNILVFNQPVIWQILALQHSRDLLKEAVVEDAVVHYENFQ